MSDTLVLRLDGARDLLAMYRWRADAIGNDIEALGRKLAAAAPFLDRSADGGAAARVPVHLRLVEASLTFGHDDLAWRIAYVESLNADGLPDALPWRDPAMRHRSIDTLIELLDGDDRFGALHELAIRAAADPDVAAAIARRFDADQLSELTEMVHYEMVDVVTAAERRRNLYAPPSTADIAAVEDVHDLINAYAIVLSGFSHEPRGRELLADHFSLDAPDHQTLRLSVALAAGRWNDEFLVDLATRAFTPPAAHGGPLVMASPLTVNPDGRQIFSRLGDPDAVLLEALVRNPDAARRFMFEHDGFWRITSDDDGYFGWFTTPKGHLVGSDRLAEARAELVRLALTDPDFRSTAFAALVGEYDPDADRRNSGVLWTIAERGEVDRHLAQALAEAWTMQWPNLANVDPSQAVADPLGGNALAVLFEHEEAREVVLGSFAPYLEAVFADAYRTNDRDAVAAAIEAADTAFQFIDTGLDAIDVDVRDRSVMRSAFGAGVGHLAKQGVSWLALSGFPAAAVLFVTGELADSMSERLLADDATEYPSTQTLLEDLFVGGGAADGALHRQPPLGEIALVNAVLDANPGLAADLSPSPWLRDGAIVPPTDLAELDRFAPWFRGVVNDDPVLREWVVETVNDLAERAAAYSTPK